MVVWRSSYLCKEHRWDLNSLLELPPSLISLLQGINIFFIKALHLGRCRHSHPLDSLLFFKILRWCSVWKKKNPCLFSTEREVSGKKKSELPGYKLLSLAQFINCTPCWLWARYWILLTCSKVAALMEGLAATSSITCKGAQVLQCGRRFECLPWVLTLFFRYFTETQPKCGFNPSQHWALLSVPEVDLPYFLGF